MVTILVVINVQQYGDYSRCYKCDNMVTILVVINVQQYGDYSRCYKFYIKEVRRENDHVVLAYVPELNELVHASTWEASVYRFERTILESSLQEQEKRIREDLETFAAKLKEYSIGGKVRSIVAKNAGEGIIKAVEEEKAELVVVGSRGKGTLRRTFMGSVSDYVVHHADVPVLVVRHEDDKHHHHKHKE
ncbi:hypothetical protein LOTGIDRAFT_234012 [Lottia gigantea]|uniref:UspA domain-containing protein n=1 Tax=Lottia gigantea TaxID=225164 RepID=V3ZFG3_LOTGI|nr:hypothetical protein LOTGIDRAFT_234012 [Lottia gigantea]ESO89873.1 hypothetical protein LOTGIDRAFT_234012 [Lottia gigantea]